MHLLLRRGHPVWATRVAHQWANHWLRGSDLASNPGFPPLTLRRRGVRIPALFGNSVMPPVITDSPVCTPCPVVELCGCSYCWGHSTCGWGYALETATLWAGRRCPALVVVRGCSAQRGSPPVEDTPGGLPSYQVSSSPDPRRASSVLRGSSSCPLGTASRRRRSTPPAASDAHTWR